MIFKFWSFLFKFLGVIFLLLIIGVLLYNNVPFIENQINEILNIPSWLA